MQEVVLAIALLPAIITAIHRFRGGWLFDGRKFGIHRRYLVTPIVAILLLPFMRWQYAIGAALQYLLFVLLPWGRWWSLGATPRNYSGNPDAFENLLESATALLPRAASDYVCFILRNLLSLAPAICYLMYAHEYAVATALLAFCVTFVITYDICWRVTAWAAAPTIYAEWLTGTQIGLLFASIAITFP